MRNHRTYRLPLSMLALVGALAAVSAQTPPPINRVVLQKGDLSVAGREYVQARAEFPAMGTTGRHTHPGEEITFVLEGSIKLEVEGDAPKMLKAGEVFMIPAGKIHNATAQGAVGAKAIAVYVVEKGKPLTTPAP